MDQPMMLNRSQPMAATKSSTSSEKSRMPRVASMGRAEDWPKHRKSGASISKSAARCSMRRW